MKLQITTSSKFKKEKEYIISALIKDFLGLDYDLHLTDNQSDYKLQFQDKSIIIRDEFFNNIANETYISKNNIPEKVTFSNFENHQNLVIIYGNNDYVFNENQIEIGLDIFASSFFMLTRWEEIAINEHDSHGRFKDKASLAIKNKFHNRPVVNEYVNLLKDQLLKIGITSDQFKNRSFTYQFSHDVDHPQLFPNFNGFAKQTTYQLVKKGNFNQAQRFTKKYFSKDQDPYNTFDILMDISEKGNTTSQFNFMNCKKGKFEEGYDLSSKFNQNLINKIQERGHKIGFHPSYNTHNSPTLWKEEKEGLEKLINQPITSGRQHYLRFKNPKTWRIWEENMMVEDSTIGYSNDVGFRAGTCFSYHPFDVIEKKKLNLIETPLILMEGSLINSLKATPEQFIEISNQLKKEVRKHNGCFTVLWHNSSFFLDNYDEYSGVLKAILD